MISESDLGPVEQQVEAEREDDGQEVPSLTAFHAFSSLVAALMSFSEGPKQGLGRLEL